MTTASVNALGGVGGLGGHGRAPLGDRRCDGPGGRPLRTLVSGRLICQAQRRDDRRSDRGRGGQWVRCPAWQWNRPVRRLRRCACSRCTPTPTTRPRRARPPWPGTPRRGCAPCSSPAPAGRRATSSTRRPTPPRFVPTSARCACGARGGGRASSATTSSTCSATAIRACPTPSPTRTPTTSPTPTSTRRWVVSSRIVRAERPQVIVSYGDGRGGGYAHPDHIRVHDISVLAFDRAGDPDWYPDAGAPWQPLKLYYSSGFSRRAHQRDARLVRRTRRGEPVQGLGRARMHRRHARHHDDPHRHRRLPRRRAARRCSRTARRSRRQVLLPRAPRRSCARSTPGRTSCSRARWSTPTR